MRQFKLREEKSFIKILKEPPQQKKKVNWSRRLYLLIFIVVAFLVVRRVYNANMIIFAQGQIDLPKQKVTFPNDIKIIDLKIAEGYEVCEGDTLFTYQVMSDELDQANLSLETPQSQDWIIRERLSIQKKIAINKILIKQKSENKDYILQRISTKESLLLSGIHNEFHEYTELQNQSAKIESDIHFLKNENNILINHLNGLNVQQKAYDNLQMNRLELFDQSKYFIAPIDGVISDVFYAANEICYKKEEMITIHQLNNSSINTYFDPEEIQHLEVGDLVDIEFPDKSKSKGVISKFFISTYAVPTEFQKKYEPTERNIVAEIVPIRKEDELSWNNFYKMEVTVQKMRYSWGI